MKMVVEIISRVLAVIAAAAFTFVFTTGRLPMIPKGRWTVATLFALGLAMCTVAGTRDGLGTSLAQPAWLTAVFTALGFSSVALLLAVLVGLNWRIGVVGLAGLIATSWLLAFGGGIYSGLDTAPSAMATVVVAAGASFAVWIASRRRLGSPWQALR
jgi:hypothetical protein